MRLDADGSLSAKQASPSFASEGIHAHTAASVARLVKLYAGTAQQFRADARMHRIAEKLRAEYTTQIGHRPAPSEVASWQNSLMALSMLVKNQAELNDHGVILEYQLGNTSRRLDAMLTAAPSPASRTRSSSSSSNGATAAFGPSPPGIKVGTRLPGRPGPVH